jgi:phosphatidylglycerol---prolipoprotein diacylglyceryl transferase
MLNLVAAITWTVSPTIVDLGLLSLRWYGLLFATGFALGYFITKRVYQETGYSEQALDTLLWFVVGGAIIGARLGHVFFYNWDYYRQHLLEIPQVWQGGLASHGGGIGLFLALWLYSRYVIKQPMLWITDRLAMSVPLAGAFIRLGNLMNHEIVGAPTEVPWAFLFTRYESVPIPRHPAQIYEALAYLLIFACLFFLFWRSNARQKPGLLTGLVLVLIFIARFLIEFVKEVQEPWEIGLTLNMGQILSIPMVLAGLALIFYARQRKQGEDSPNKQSTQSV